MVQCCVLRHDVFIRTKIQQHHYDIVMLKIYLDSFGLFNVHINRSGSYLDNRVFDFVFFTLLGDDQLSTSTRFFYVPLEIQ